MATLRAVLAMASMTRLCGARRTSSRGGIRRYGLLLRFEHSRIERVEVGDLDVGAVPSRGDRRTRRHAGQFGAVGGFFRRGHAENLSRSPVQWKVVCLKGGRSSASP